MKKKGMFITLSIFLLMTSVLTFSIVINQYTNEEKIERMYEFVAMDKLFDLSYSVENSITEILMLYINLGFKTEQNPDGTYNITIWDNISRTEGSLEEDFNTQMENLKTFIEGKEPNIYLDLDVLEGEELPLEIDDYNITYLRSWEIGHVVLSIIPDTLNFDTYDVLIDAGNEEIVSVDTPTKAGDFSFRVRVIDNFGGDIVEENNINPERKSQIITEFDSGSIIKVIVEDNNLNIWTDSDNILNVKMTAGNIQPLSHEPGIAYFKDAINTTFPNLEISKIGSIII